MKPVITLLAALCFLSLMVQQGAAHGGGLDKDGCHTNSQTGEYHCHGEKDGGDDSADAESAAE